MNRTKENIIFVLIFSVVFAIVTTAFEFWIYDWVKIEKNIIVGLTVSILLLLDKIYKFSDKIKQKLTFIK
ncbi:hypothetical protein L3049_14540 [Labilibaculum sp. DW002]|uniref:Uncharacterized protein n=1 Tax=Paralabilibaculum antarcticum TaxID=2912572 RepID=A0ABT5VUW6_9BACT|nr:hypothetical protein [Labilibaculum sp. DW002]MDE5419215.1 hypothetical protein [Labilibaculum sp. DW002]